MSIHQFKYPDPLSAAKACAHNICTELEVALAGEADATLAVSGGTTPKLMFEEMARQKFDWKRVHLFWVDERAVPPTGDESNFRMAEQSFILPAHFPRRNVHRIHGELLPQVAAARYVDEIREYFQLGEGDIPHFDVIHRGIGPDCHTASLFPGEPLIEDRELLAAAVYVEKFEKWRITMLPGLLTNARHTVMLVCGKDKEDAVRQIFEEPYQPLKYPAQITSHGGRSVTWFMDDAAARLMP